MKEPDKQGNRGSQGCRIWSFTPGKMLSFDWNFPPDIPSLRYSGAMTHVTLLFDEVRGKVRVRFRQLGWQQGDDWAAGYAYFDKAWSYVLEQLKRRFEK